MALVFLRPGWVVLFCSCVSMGSAAGSVAGAAAGLRPDASCNAAERLGFFAGILSTCLLIYLSTCIGVYTSKSIELEVCTYPLVKLADFLGGLPARLVLLGGLPHGERMLKRGALSDMHWRDGNAIAVHGLLGVLSQ